MLLLDENLSPKLPGLLAASFPGSAHVRERGLKGATDAKIWEYAGKRSLILVSKDRDFYERSLLYGAPPKFVWLRIGNCTRSDLLRMFNAHARDIHGLAASQRASMLIVS